MPRLIVPEYVFADIIRFISGTYHNDLPNSLLIAQAFCLKFQDYGKEFGLSAINNAVEDIIKNSRNNK